MAGHNVVSVTGANFDQVVAKSATPVLLDFWASWCGPCKMLAPLVDELANEYAGKVTFGKVDIDAEQELAAQFNIQSIPTLIFFKGGKPVGQVLGLRGKRELKTALDQTLAG